MKLPYRFEDMTLAQFIKLHELEQDKSLDIIDRNIQKLSILSGKSIESIELMDLKHIRLYLSKIAYTSNAPKNLPIPPRFWCGKYLLTPTMSLQEMGVNQFVDYFTILKANDGNHIKCANDLLAIMFKPYKLIGKSKYSPDAHSKISKQLLSAKVGDCLGLLFFYLNLWVKCEPFIVSCLESSNQTIAKIWDEIQNDKEFQDFLKDGGGNTI
jgi:hypothetical protein